MFDKAKRIQSEFSVSGAGVLVCFSWVWQMDNKAPQLNYSEIRQQFEQENVEEVSFPDEHTLVLTLRREVEGQPDIRYRIYDFQIFYEDMHELLEAQKAKGILTYDYPSAPPETGWRSCFRSF